MRITLSMGTLALSPSSASFDSETAASEVSCFVAVLCAELTAAPSPFCPMEHLRHPGTWLMASVLAVCGSQVWIIGQSGTSVYPEFSAQPLLIKVVHGAPPVHIYSVRLLGQLEVRGGELKLNDCVIEPAAPTNASRAATQDHNSGGRRALLIFQGDVILTRTIFRAHKAGALEVNAANVVLIECTLQDCGAQTGGALRVRGNANMIIVQSTFADNTAAVSGGALQGGTLALRIAALVEYALPFFVARTTLHFHYIHACFAICAQVDSGNVHVLNQTRFERNTAPDRQGASIYLDSAGKLQYTLPAPPGRWLNIRQGVTFHLDAGPVDVDFPFACSAGLVGGVLAEEQSGPGCSSLW